MAKVKVLSTFIGTDAELSKYGGQIPAEQKKWEKRMSEGEKAAFKGKITAGTEIEVDDKRAHELAAAGIVEFKGAEKADYHTRDLDSKENVRTVEKVADAQPKDEKNKNAGPGTAKK